MISNNVNRGLTVACAVGMLVLGGCGHAGSSNAAATVDQWSSDGSTDAATTEPGSSDEATTGPGSSTVTATSRTTPATRTTSTTSATPGGKRTTGTGAPSGRPSKPSSSQTSPSRDKGRKPTTPPDSNRKPTSPSTLRTPTTPGTVAGRVLAIVNAERAEAGCRPVKANAALDRAATGHSVDMMKKNYFSHTSQDGRDFVARVKAAGYPHGRLGETIAGGQTTPESVMESWMASKGHRDIILTCAYREVGIGYAKGGSMKHYWTMDFGGS